MSGGGDRERADPRTLAVHAGSEPDPVTGAEGVLIARTTGFAFESAEQMEAAFRGRNDHYIYSRYGNPTLRACEVKLAALERAGEGYDAVVYSSGMAAISAALLAVMQNGDHLVAQRELYGGTTGLLTTTLARAGLACDFLPAADLADPARLDAAAKPTTRALYIESPVNPTLAVVDIEAVCRLAHERGWTVIIDNTFASPIVQRPLALGCDLVVHSATKYLGGHDDLTAGFVVASGEILARLRRLRIDLGGCLDPEAGWLLARSMQTVALRVAAQGETAMALARHFAAHRLVGRVWYPGLPEHPGHDIAARQMRGFGGMVAFELRADESAAARVAARFVKSLRMIRLVPTLGGVCTTIVIPAISSHINLTREQRREMGVTDGLLRLSAGIEAVPDLTADLDAAMEAAVQ